MPSGSLTNIPVSSGLAGIHDAPALLAPAGSDPHRVQERWAGFLGRPRTGASALGVLRFYDRPAATHFVLGASGDVDPVNVRACAVGAPSTYCTPAKPAGGCVARRTFLGAPSATGGSGFLIQAQSVDAKRVALLFQDTNGPWGQKLSDGFLCVKAPVVRPCVGTAGGAAACSGNLALDFNAWVASGNDSKLVAGQAVRAPAWLRNSSAAGQLADALAFLIGH